MSDLSQPDFGNAGTQSRPTKFNWLGRMLANSAILFARREARVRKIDDVFDRETLVSTSGAASKLNWTVLKNLLGMKFTLIQGYREAATACSPCSGGEVDALSMEWSILRILGAPLIRDRKINLLLQTRSR